MSKENVDHPKHYGGEDNLYEAIKVIEAWTLGFNFRQYSEVYFQSRKKTGVDDRGRFGEGGVVS